jgi:hypothetical protein
LKIDPSILEIPRQKADEKVCVVSYPKSGRTWLRVLLSRYKQKMHGIDEFHLKLHALFVGEPEYSPQFIFHHGIHTMRPTKNTMGAKLDQILGTGRDQYDHAFDIGCCDGMTKIFMVRDPRDVVVSYFHQLSFRQDEYRGSIDAFVRDKRFGIAPLVTFMNFCVESYENTRAMFLYYEDLHANPQETLATLFEFVGMKSATVVLDDAIQFERFENMKQMERRALHGDKLSPVDKEDERTYKVRKGTVGGFREELRQRTKDFLVQYIKTHLNPFYDRYL